MTRAAAAGGLATLVLALAAAPGWAQSGAAGRAPGANVESLLELARS